MIEESLFKSNFIGRDGFRWWIGQIPPLDDETSNYGGGWGNKFKVRILGYHPLDDKELKNEDLPWAQVMLSTTDGTGGAGNSKSVKLRQGDVVLGFFMDGDNAQIPVIIGTFGKTELYSASEYKFPFQPFTGYNNNVKKPDKSVSTAKESNEQKATSQEAPVQLPAEKARSLDRAPAGGSVIGKSLSPANTCENTSLTNIENELENLIKYIEDNGLTKIEEYKDKIDESAEFIKSSMSWLVGEIFKQINLFLVGNDENEGIIPKALNALYLSVYTPLAASAGPAVAHATASETIVSFSPLLEALEKALICVANAILEGLVTLIRELLLSMLENIERFVTCIVDQFVGSLLSNIVDQIASGLKGALDGISGLLGGIIDIASVAQDAISLFNSFGDLLDCNQKNTKCDGTKKWIIGAGPKDAMEINQSFDSIFNIVNTASSLADAAIDTVQGFPSDIQRISGGISDVIDIFNGDSLIEGRGKCLTTYPSSCGSATIKIFGGGGIGGEAVPIFGPTIERIVNDTSIGRNINRTSNIIGATITKAGSGYRFPPFIEITDECGLGYGARARCTINDKGEIDSIYMVSSGENYPPISQDNQVVYGVTDVTVVATGIGYEQGDTAFDNFGNEYELIIDEGKIISANPINITEASDLVTITVNSDTGLGAVLKPTLGQIGDISSQASQASQASQKEVIQVIDCIS